MRHLSITLKFLALLISVGIFVLGSVAYSSHQMTRIDAAYDKLIEGEEAALVNLARANRALQTARAAIGDLLMARNQAGKRAAASELETARSSFLKFADAAIRALPENPELRPLRTNGLQILDEICGPTIARAQRSISTEDILGSQQQFLGECQPHFRRRPNLRSTWPSA